MPNCRGLHDKYKVIRKETGEELDGCFVLHVTTDTAAWHAAMFYSYLTHNPRLGKELRAWLNELKVEQVSEGETIHEFGGKMLHQVFGGGIERTKDDDT